MPLFMYRCPKTGYRVQGFVAEDTSEDQHVYEPDPSCESAYRRRLGRKGRVGERLAAVIADPTKQS
jgi:predicted nucleic acid-binding Zn ribbon protein